MPIENEFKFVVAKNSISELYLSPFFKSVSMMQAYLTDDGSTRLRISNGDGVLTFKKMCNGALVEIETPIDARDVVRLWNSADKRLYKVRYEYLDTTDGKWCVDYLFDDNNVIYFAMAEVELPEDETVGKIPEIILKNIIYTVAKDDKRFYNSKLCDIGYGKDLYKILEPWSKSDGKDN